jgi:hypothetical protein
VSFGGDAIAFLNIGDEATDFDNVARELVTDDEGGFAARLRPVIPLVNVHVRAAHSGTPHTDQNLVVSDSRLGNIAKNESRTCRFLHQCFHFFPPLGCCFTS